MVITAVFHKFMIKNEIVHLWWYCFNLVRHITHFRSEQVARDEKVRDREEPSGPSEVKYPTEEVQLISMTPRSTVRGSNDFAVKSIYFSSGNIITLGKHFNSSLSGPLS